MEQKLLQIASGSKVVKLIENDIANSSQAVVHVSFL